MMSNIDVPEITTSSAEMFGFLRELTGLLGESYDRPNIEYLLTKACQLIEADAGSIILVNEDGILACEYSHKWTKRRIDKFESLKLRVGEGFLGKLMAQGRAVLINDSDLLNRSMQTLDESVDSLIFVPLRYDGRVVGSICASKHDGAFSKEQFDLMKAISGLMNLVIRTKKLHMEKNRIKRLHDELSTINQKYNPGSQRTLRQYLSKLLDFCPYDKAMILTSDREGKFLESYASYGIADKKPVRFDLSKKSLPQEAFSTRRLLMSNDMNEYTGRGYLNNLNARAVIAVPIILKGRSIGTLTLGITKKNKTFNNLHIELAKITASKIALALENIRLFTELNDRKNQWEAVFKNVSEGVFIIDSGYKLQAVNSIVEKMIGTKSNKLAGKSIAAVFDVNTPGMNQLSFSATLKKVFSEGRSVKSQEERIVNSRGKTLWVQMTISPISQRGEKITHAVGLLHNITAEKATEETKSDFISIVSHELRTPLTAIKGFLSMILKRDVGELNEMQFHFLNRVYQSNERMVALVEDLLDVTRIESGRISLSFVPVDMYKLVHECITELAHKGFEKQVTLEINRKHRLPLILADDSRARQIVMNLVDNAIKYSQPKGKVEIDFRVRPDELEITVRDNGVGIDPSQQDKIFQKFGRAASKEMVSGSGLGLYIVKNLIEAQGGRIWFASRQNKGSEFSFTLPIAKQLPLIV